MTMLSCSENKETKEILPLGIRKITSIEILQTSSYTYIKGKENNSEIWLAIRRMDVEKGKILYFNGNKTLEMHNFKSKELNRVFETILFLDKVSYTPNRENKPQVEAKKTAFLRKEIKIVSPDDCITIAELFKNKEKYADKKVKIKAEVTKFTPNIMGKNWMHIQDGTEYKDKYDLTITSKLTSKKGDIHIIEGVARMNKDFGAGYSYECIIENSIFM